MRLPEIIDILTHKSVSSQEELSKQLAVRGFIVTQATLSRDLKTLKANKVSDDRGGYRYVVADGQSYGRRSRRGTAMVTSHSSVLSVARTGNLAVIKTRNGYASASGLAYDIDMLESRLVLGTIPGADTVFVALKDGVSNEELFALFSTFLPASVMNAAATLRVESAGSQSE